jgi:hypothetical protein
MTLDWSDELGVLDEVAPSRDLWLEALERVGKTQSISGSRRRSVLLVVGVLAAAATGFGVSALLQGAGSTPSPTAGSAPGGLRPIITTLGVNPFGDGGKVLTLQEFVALEADRGYDVPLPDSPLANSANVGDIWEQTATGEVVVYFPSSGIELNYGGTGVDYTGVPADDIQTINGVRAIVWPPGSAGSRYAAVLLPIPSGHLVTLMSNGPLSDLVNVAKTIPLR